MTRIRGKKGYFERPASVEEGSVLSIFRVPPEVAGQRVDVFLHGQLKRTSRTRAQTILRLSAFAEDGRKLRPGSRVKAEQKIMLWRAPWDESPVPTEVPILYEDDHLFVVNKPANLPVHPSARYHKNTLIKALERARPDAPFLSLGHRLDRETSGALVVSKSPACDRAVKRLFERRDGVEKTYLAITHGIPEGLRAGEPLRLERSIELDPTHSTRVKMRVGETPTALQSSTIFHLEATARGRNDALYARVRCDLETGRQHQIRIHLASLGAHIVGDKLYGWDDALFARGVDGELTPADLALLELPRHALHAARLAIPHPMIADARLEVFAPLPDDMAHFWASLSPPRERE